jgi:hypothetical protein
VQVAVATEYHLIMMHELTKVGSDHTNGWDPRRVRSLRHKQDPPARLSQKNLIVLGYA